MAEIGVQTVIECGVGEVLCGLTKRTQPSLNLLKVNDLASLNQTRESLAAEPANSRS
jgi:malonyl CoA-acyl carrier protein transacylase